MQYFFILFMLWVTNIAFAQESTIPIALERAPVNIHNTASIQRGAKFFAANCMICHTMIYLRYDKLAQANGVLYDKMPINVKQWPNNATPPDLSLEASRRGVNWIYTYLHSFYLDPSRPTGANNLLRPQTAMPAILATYQGQQILVPKADMGKKMYDKTYQWYDLLTIQTNGTMTEEQVDATITDLVNFLSYASNPHQVEQYKIGWFVFGSLIILVIFMYLLKREYWKNL
jgi:ubiquinol-cytochrome c reductase cytochrome c1 subunit